MTEAASPFEMFVTCTRIQSGTSKKTTVLMLIAVRASPSHVGTADSVVQLKWEWINEKWYKNFASFNISDFL